MKNFGSYSVNKYTNHEKFNTRGSSVFNCNMLLIENEKQKNTAIWSFFNFLLHVKWLETASFL